MSVIVRNLSSDSFIVFAKGEQIFLIARHFTVENFMVEKWLPVGTVDILSVVVRHDSKDNFRTFLAVIMRDLSSYILELFVKGTDTDTVIMP
jgi:hypothetical protein